VNSSEESPIWIVEFKDGRGDEEDFAHPSAQITNSEDHHNFCGPNSPHYPMEPESSTGTFKLSICPEEKFSNPGAVVKEGKKAVLRRLNSENSDLKRSIAHINQQIAATDAENRILKQSIIFFNEQLRQLGILPVIINNDTDGTNPPQIA
jgi:hypothetical protein